MRQVSREKRCVNAVGQSATEAGNLKLSALIFELGTDVPTVSPVVSLRTARMRPSGSVNSSSSALSNLLFSFCERCWPRILSETTREAMPVRLSTGYISECF
jgi:hypothetical protein